MYTIDHPDFTVSNIMRNSIGTKRDESDSFMRYPANKVCMRPLVKSVHKKNIFLISQQNVCCGYSKEPAQSMVLLRTTKQRGTFICAHAWIFFKLCILIIHYI